MFAHDNGIDKIVAEVNIVRMLDNGETIKIRDITLNPYVCGIDFAIKYAKEEAAYRR